MKEAGLKAIAKLYTDHKPALIRLMNKYGADINKSTKHIDIILDLEYLIYNSQEFCQELDALLIEKGIINSDFVWNNQTDPISAIVAGVGDIFGGISGMVTSKREQEMQEDRFLYSMLQEQNKSDNKTILIVSGITFIGLGLALFFILKRKK